MAADSDLDYEPKGNYKGPSRWLSLASCGIGVCFALPMLLLQIQQLLSLHPPNLPVEVEWAIGVGGCLGPFVALVGVALGLVAFLKEPAYRPWAIVGLSLNAAPYATLIAVLAYRVVSGRL
jgi:hypothetical protein